MAFKMLTGRVEQGRLPMIDRERQFLATILRPRAPARTCFKCDIISHWAKHRASPCLLPGFCPNCGQVEHWRVYCPLCLVKVGQSPEYLLHKKLSRVFWAWPLKTDTALEPQPPTNSSSYHRWSQDNRLHHF